MALAFHSRQDFLDGEGATPFRRGFFNRQQSYGNQEVGSPASHKFLLGRVSLRDRKPATYVTATTSTSIRRDTATHTFAGEALHLTPGANAAMMGAVLKRFNTMAMTEEVAQRATVSIATVSYVLNGTGPVSPGTR